ncbi:MAG: hypothetical protein H0X46_06855 [Bacteroidetes bacterium]|nr:hypothetical protein [Bacteroidota bacterium]
MTTHYAYVKGVVVDSIAGLPLPNAIVYSSYKVFSSGNSGPGSDTTDVNGAYTRRIVWYVGRSLSSVLLSRPGDSTDLYINSYSNNSCNFLKIKWGQLIENDTIILSVISSKPYAYVGTHIKEVLPVSSGVTVNWDPAIIGRISDMYPANSDTIVTQKICPNLKTYISWSGNSDSVFVNSGDTAFVDVFY